MELLIGFLGTILEVMLRKASKANFDLLYHAMVLQLLTIGHQLEVKKSSS